MNINSVFLVGFFTLGMNSLGLAQVPSDPPAWGLELRHQVPIQEGSKNYHRVTTRGTMGSQENGFGDLRCVGFSSLPQCCS